MSALACLDRERLAAWIQGKLPDDADDVLEAHVDHCLACQQALSMMDRLADPLIAQIHGPVAVAVTVNGPDLVVLMDRAKAIGSPRLPDTASCLPPPQRLGEYRLLELLGEGGMGQVYKALHTRLNRLVAVKILPAERLRSVEAVARFEREMTAVGSLEHPHIVRATDAGVADGRYYLVMELLEGEDLGRLVRRCGPLPVADACDYVRQAALGLEHAHSRGLVHRDVKPSNLLRLPDGRVKVLDLGLALIAEGAAGSPGTLSGQMMGTPDYIAPEQIDNARAVTGGADIYSLGCTLYHLLAGRVPFPDLTMLQKLHAHAAQQPTPLHQLRPDIPTGLVEVINTMIAKKPADRYATAAAIAEALRPFCQSPRETDTVREGRIASSASPTLAERAEPARLGRTPRARIWVGVAVVGLLAVAACMIALRTRPVVQSKQPPGETRKRLEYVTSLSGHTVPVDSVAFSAHGRAASSNYRQSGLFLWDLEKHGQLHRWSPGVHVTAVGFLPDGRSVVSGNERGHISLWTVGNQKAKSFPVPEGGGILDLAISADGTRVVAGTSKNGVHVLSLQTGQPVRGPFKHSSNVSAVAFSPKGDLVASGSSDRSVRIWNLNSGAQEQAFQGHTGEVCRVGFAPDGERVFSLGRRTQSKKDRTLRVWNIRTGKEVRPPIEITATDQGVCGAFSADGKRALIGYDDGTLTLWDLENGQALDSARQHKGTVRCVALSADGRQALSGGEDETVRLWRLTSPPSK